MGRIRCATEAPSSDVSASPACPKTAVDGEYGDVHRTHRTKGGKLWINPLMNMYWGFDLSAVAQRSLYLPAVKRTKSIWDVNAVIEAFRMHQVEAKPWQDIPV